MGRHIPIVSFLCGVIFRRKPPAVEDDDDDDPEENTVDSPSSTSSSDDGRLSMEDALSKPCSPEAHQQPLPLPLPPGNGNFHMRTVSCGHNMDYHHQPHQHHRSNSGVGKLMSSMSLKVMGGGGGGGGGTTNVFASLGSASGRFKERTLRYFKHEESVWKKTIILGERCRVPDEDDDDINLYDEKGNKITTYHPKAYSGLLQQYSRQTSHQE